MELYKERDCSELEPYFFNHMMALTSENLVCKHAIAAELAARDKENAELRAQLAIITRSYLEKTNTHTDS